MEFRWVKGNVNPNITLDQFVETIVFQDTYDTDYYDLKYPGLILHIVLQRKVQVLRQDQLDQLDHDHGFDLQYHLMQTYIPSFLFVTIAWLSLFVNPEAIPGRISMVMMTLLTLMAMFSGVRQSVPKVRIYSNYPDLTVNTLLL